MAILTNQELIARNLEYSRYNTSRSFNESLWKTLSICRCLTSITYMWARKSLFSYRNLQAGIYYINLKED